MAVLPKQAHTLNRGDTSMRRNKKQAEQEVPTIVHTYYFGNSKVHIASNHFATTKEEKEKILQEHHAIGWRIAQQQVAAGKE